MPGRDKRVVLGWREYLAIPEWGIDRILTKIDTGARSSAIDVLNLEELPDDRVRFDVALSRRDRDRRVTVVAPIARRTRVRSSNGQMAERLVVAVTIAAGSARQTIEVGLTCRRRMLCRMLLGRSALADQFLVDAGHRYLLHGGKRPRRKRKRKDSVDS